MYHRLGITLYPTSSLFCPSRYFWARYPSRYDDSRMVASFLIITNVSSCTRPVTRARSVVVDSPDFRVLTIWRGGIHLGRPLPKFSASPRFSEWALCSMYGVSNPLLLWPTITSGSNASTNFANAASIAFSTHSVDGSRRIRAFWASDNAPVAFARSGEFVVGLGVGVVVCVVGVVVGVIAGAAIRTVDDATDTANDVVD